MTKKKVLAANLTGWRLFHAPSSQGQSPETKFECWFRVMTGYCIFAAVDAPLSSGRQRETPYLYG